MRHTALEYERLFAKELAGTRLSGDAVQVLNEADAEAERLSHHYVGGGHLLVGYFSHPGNRSILIGLNTDLETVRRTNQALLGRGWTSNGDRRVTDIVRRGIVAGVQEARDFGENSLSDARLMLGVIESSSIGDAAQVLSCFVSDMNIVRGKFLAARVARTPVLRPG